MGLFPFFGDALPTEVESLTELPLYKEVAWDFTNNIPIVEKGEYKIVEGAEAVKTWVFKAMKTERFRYRIYSWDFGNELDSLIGQSFSPNLTKAECVRYVEEALLINPYITGISEVEVEFYEGRLDISMKLETIYGTEEVSVNV